MPSTHSSSGAQFIACWFKQSTSVLLEWQVLWGLYGFTQMSAEALHPLTHSHHRRKPFNGRRVTVNSHSAWCMPRCQTASPYAGKVLAHLSSSLCAESTCCFAARTPSVSSQLRLAFSASKELVIALRHLQVTIACVPDQTGCSFINTSCTKGSLES